MRPQYFYACLLMLLANLLETGPVLAQDQEPRLQDDTFAGEIGAHHRVHTWTTQGRDASGRSVHVPHRVVELASGMHYWSGTAWLPSDPRFEITETEFVAHKIGHKIWLPGNLNMKEAVTIQTPDGQVLHSTPLAIGLYDAASGDSIIIGAIQDCEGLQVNDTQVVYENAFHGDGIWADVVYTVGPASFHQDVVIRGRLDPSLYGFPTNSTRIQIFTEFYDPPKPERMRRPLRVEEDEAVRSRMVSPDFVDEVLSFGELTFWTGSAYTDASDAKELGGAPVAKEWLRGERTFLVESAEFGDLAEEMEMLPEVELDAASDQASRQMRRKSGDATALIAQAPVKEEARRFAPKRVLELAASTPRRQGIVIDYYATLSPTTSLLCGDTTYYVSAPVALGAVTIEGGTVVKYAENAYVQLNSTVTCKTSSHRPAILTAKDDGTVGEPVPGAATSVPGNNTYANPALYTWFLTGPALSNLQIRYAKGGIGFLGSSGYTASISNVQLVNCIRGITISGCGSGCGGCAASVTVNNTLFASVNQPLSAGSPFGASCTLNNCTVDNTPWTADPCRLATVSSGSATFTFKNSVIARVSVLSSGSATVTGSYNGFYSSVGTGLPFGTSQVLAQAYPFQTKGAGAYYLASGSNFKDAGTLAGLSTAFLAELRTRTTDPPRAVPGAIAVDTQLIPIVQRDDNAIDLGYHYDVLDYILENVFLSASLTLVNGVNAGVGGAYGLDVQPGANVTSTGSPVLRNRFVSMANVQEQPYGGGSTLLRLNASISASKLDFRFTDFSVGQGTLGTLVSNPGNPVALFSMRDCWLRCASLTLSPTASSTAVVKLNNNLIERCGLSFTHVYNAPSTVSLYNNLFLRCPNSASPGTAPALTITYTTGGSTHPNWPVQDNLFDGAPQSVAGSTYVIGGYNGFVGTTANALGGTGNATALSANYVVGPFGSYYYPSSGAAPSLASIKAAGNLAASASEIGLYHYCPTLENVKKAHDPVGIGMHYPVTENAALNTPGSRVTQSSTINPYDATRAVDGNIDGVLANGSVTRTGYDNQAWWQIDLGSVRTIDRINVYNRTDGTPAEFSNFYILVCDNPILSTDLEPARAQAGVSSYYTAGQAGRPTIMIIGRTGQYVRIQLAGQNYLSIAEVQILTASDADVDGADGLADCIEDSNGNGSYEGGSDLSSWLYNDTDNDDLNDYFEWLWGVADADGDGLPDGYEASVTKTDPWLAQTTPGVSDGSLDIDGNGISNLMEFKGLTKVIAYSYYPVAIQDFSRCEVIIQRPNTIGGSSTVSFTKTGATSSCTLKNEAGTTLGTTITIPANNRVTRLFVVPNTTPITADTLTLRLSGITPSGPAWDNTDVVVSILPSNWTPPSVNLDVSGSDLEALETGTELQRTGFVRITRSPAGPPGPLPVRVRVAGTATPGADYDLIANGVVLASGGGPFVEGMVTIPAGSQDLYINVLAKPDSAPEYTESVVLQLEGGSGYTVGSPASATVLIKDGTTGDAGGLTGTYYSTADFMGYSVTRNDSVVDFVWNGEAPVLGVGTDYSVRWTGNWHVTYKGLTYTFFVTSESAASLSIGGQAIPLIPTGNPYEYSGSKLIQATDPNDYGIQLDYSHSNGSASIVRLEWQQTTYVPRGVLTTPALTQLTGYYYPNTTWNGSPLTTRGETSVNYAWGYQQPTRDFGVNTYSIRWTGKIIPEYTENYRFFTTSDGKVRLVVNGQQLFNDQTQYLIPTVNSGTISLSAGIAYDLTLEYSHAHPPGPGRAQIQLEWQSASQPRELVPAERLDLSNPAWVGCLMYVAKPTASYLVTGYCILERKGSLGSTPAVTMTIGEGDGQYQQVPGYAIQLDGAAYPGAPFNMQVLETGNPFTLPITFNWPAGVAQIRVAVYPNSAPTLPYYVRLVLNDGSGRSGLITVLPAAGSYPDLLNDTLVWLNNAHTSLSFVAGGGAQGVEIKQGPSSPWNAPYSYQSRDVPVFFMLNGRAVATSSQTSYDAGVDYRVNTTVSGVSDVTVQHISPLIKSIHFGHSSSPWGSPDGPTVRSSISPSIAVVGAGSFFGNALRSGFVTLLPSPEYIVSKDGYEWDDGQRAMRFRKSGSNYPDNANYDSDNDGTSDSAEIVARTDPLNPDTYGVGRPDGYGGSDDDSDGDGLSRLREFHLRVIRTDADGDTDHLKNLSDFKEVGDRTNPLAKSADLQAPTVNTVVQTVL